MKSYLNMIHRVLTEGEWVMNERTGKRCLTLINVDMEYDVSDGRLPILTTKKMAWKPAVAEFLCYLCGCDNAAQFRAAGTNTWNANANENQQWLNNPWRRGEDDMGRAYGVQLRHWLEPNKDMGGRPVEVDQLQMVYDDLSRGIDNRREILTMWNPGETERMCLPACMHTHTFSILNGTLYLTSYQRSDDLALGHPFNQIQCGWFLLVMAKICGLKPGKVFHKIVNAHLYEDQVEIMKTVQLVRKPHPRPKLVISDEIVDLESLLNSTISDYQLDGYIHEDAIAYPFSV